jgi:hypothetical protein
MNHFVNKTAILILLSGWLNLTAKDISVAAYANKTSVGQYQQFTLSVEISGEGASGVANPQLPEMEDFASFLGSGSSQNIQFVNGKMSVSKVLSYHYQATKLGNHEIGPVVVKYQGQTYSTQPIQIEIKATGGRPSASDNSQKKERVTSNTGDDLFVEATVNKKRVFQNEPVTITYKIFTRLQVASFGFSKEPATTGFWKEDYELPAQPVTSSEIVNGKQYTVATIKKIALYPMTPGSKKIDPLVITCEVRSRSRSRDPFDSFFNDPFFGRTKTVQVPSNAINIEVLTLPETDRPADFNGAVGKFKMSAWTDKTQAKTNEAVTFKLKIEGQGNIHHLNPTVQISGDFETYPPKETETIQRQNEPISGSKVYEYVLIPRLPGKQKIDAVTISYFDPEAKVYKTLATDPIFIDVEKGQETFSMVPAGATKEQVKWLGKDIRFISTSPVEFQRIGLTFYHSFSFWIILVAPLFALFGALGYRRHLNRLDVDVAYARERRARRAARRGLARARQLLKAETQKAFYTEMGTALLKFLGDKLNVAEAGLISEDIRKMLKVRKVNPTLIEELFSILDSCDYQRFAPSEASEPDMQRFLKRSEKVMSDLDRELRK